MIKISNYLLFAIWVLGIISFNSFFFLFMGVEHTPSCWISYGFINFAIFTLLVPILISPKDGRHAVLYNPLSSITITYLILEIIIGICFIAINLEDYRITLLVQVIALFIYFILMAMNYGANKKTIAAIEKQDRNRQYVKTATEDLSIVLNQITDKAKRYKIERAYDIIHSSPIKSDSSVYSIEDDVLYEIKKLSSLANHGNLEEIEGVAEKICSLANLRNKKLMNS